MIHDSSNLSNKIYIGHAAYSLAYSILHAHYRPAPPNSPTDQPADQPTNQPTSQPDTNPIHPCPPACCHLHGCWVLFMGSQPRAHVHRACTPTSHAMHRALPQRMLCSCNNNQSTNQRGNHQPASQPASQPNKQPANQPTNQLTVITKHNQGKASNQPTNNQQPPN